MTFLKTASVTLLALFAFSTGAQAMTPASDASKGRTFIDYPDTKRIQDQSVSDSLSATAKIRLGL